MIDKIKEIYENEVYRLISGGALFFAALILDLLRISVPSTVLYLLALLIAGAPVFASAVRGILRRDLFDEKFLMSVAAVGAIIIGDMSEGVAVMLFFLLGEIFEHKAVRRSRNSIKELMSIRPDEATVIVDGKEEVLDAEDVSVGSEIVIRAGERVPIDSTVVSGGADINTAMLTGESIPRFVKAGDRIESGCIVLDGVICARTERTADESSAQRILELVENASENKAREESFITVFSRFYTPIVVFLALFLAILPPLFIDSISWSESVYRALTFLVISCPCALVISVPMAFFGGIGAAASEGILFKGGNVFSPLGKADSFVFDKTGTLTTGEISVDRVIPYGVDEETLCYFAASAEYGSLHPISLAIKRLSDSSKIPESTREISGKGIAARVDGEEILVGNEALFSDFGVDIPLGEREGVFVSKGGIFIGRIILGDRVRPEALDTVSALKKSGAKSLYMLSGDRVDKVKGVADIVGIENYEAELLPEDKYNKLKKIVEKSTKTAFVGDGINDSPSLALSDVGIAMGGVGSDSAIEAADVVIMNDDLSKIPKARSIARKTIRIAKQNIVFAIGVKALVLILGALGYADMWLAVFADVGVAVLAILNSMRALRIRK